VATTTSTRSKRSPALFQPRDDCDSIRNATEDMLRFAVEGILHHANEAAKSGIDQGEFLQSFPLLHYTHANVPIDSLGRIPAEEACGCFVEANKELLPQATTPARQHFSSGPFKRGM
jgi:hypothetical protein